MLSMLSFRRFNLLNEPIIYVCGIGYVVLVLFYVTFIDFAAKCLSKIAVHTADHSEAVWLLAVS